MKTISCQSEEFWRKIHNNFMGKRLNWWTVFKGLFNKRVPTTENYWGINVLFLESCFYISQVFSENKLFQTFQKFTKGKMRRWTYISQTSMRMTHSLKAKRLHYTLDTGRKLNVHKAFSRCPKRLLNVLCRYNLHTSCTRGYRHRPNFKNSFHGN